MTVTRVGVEQCFKVRDLRRVQYWPVSMGMAGHHHMHASPHRQGHSNPSLCAQRPFGHLNTDIWAPIPNQDLSSKLFYLFTSGDNVFQSHFSERPMPTPPVAGEERSRLDSNVVRCFAYPTASVLFKLSMRYDSELADIYMTLVPTVSWITSSCMQKTSPAKDYLLLWLGGYFVFF